MNAKIFKESEEGETHVEWEEGQWEWIEKLKG